MGSKLLRDRNFHIIIGMFASLFVGAAAEYLIIPNISSGLLHITIGQEMSPAFAWISFFAGLLVIFPMNFRRKQEPVFIFIYYIVAWMISAAWGIAHIPELRDVVVGQPWYNHFEVMNGSSCTAWICGLTSFLAVLSVGMYFTHSAPARTKSSFVTGALIGMIVPTSGALNEVWLNNTTRPYFWLYALMLALYIVPMQIWSGDTRLHHPFRWMRTNLKLMRRVRRMKENHRRLLELETSESELFDKIIKVRREKKEILKRKPEGKGAYRVQVTPDVQSRPVPDPEIEADLEDHEDGKERRNIG